MKIENGTVNFAVYEDATEFYGMAEVTLPEVNNKTEMIKGAGMNGEFAGVYVGHVEAMSLSLNFRSVTPDTLRLTEPRNHQIDLRGAQQEWDYTAGKFIVHSVRHVLVVNPMGFNPGKLAPSSPADASGKYSVTYYATFIDEKKVLEIDILNFIYYLNGVDYLADVRRALGK